MSEKLLNFIETSSDEELNKVLVKAKFKTQKKMNLQLTTIGSFTEAKALIEALNVLDDKRLACRITRRFHNYYQKSFYLLYLSHKGKITPTEYTLKIQELFVNTCTLGSVHRKARNANIPYLYFSAVCRLHHWKMYLQRTGNAVN